MEFSSASFAFLKYSSVFSYLITNQVPLTVKKELLYSPTERSFLYCLVKFPRPKPKLVHSYNHLLPLGPLLFVPSPKGCGFGDYHFKKIIYTKFSDTTSPSIFSFYFSTYTTTNFCSMYTALMDTIKNTAAGQSYKKRKKIDSLSTIIRYLYNFSFFDASTLIAYREKSELVSLVKLQKRPKVRLFASCDSHTEVLMRYFFFNAIQQLLTKHPRIYKNGYSAYHCGIDYMFGSLDISNFQSLDASDCDSTISLNLMLCGLRLMLHQTTYNQYEIYLCMQFLAWFIMQPRKYKGIIFAVKGALPSGMYLTSMLTSFVIIYVQTKIFNTDIKGLSSFSFNSGDDLALMKDKVSIFINNINKFGMDYSVASYQGLEFLSAYYLRVYQNKYISIPKNLDKLWGILRFAPQQLNSSQLYELFFCLYVLYFYYFMFDVNWFENYLRFFYVITCISSENYFKLHYTWTYRAFSIIFTDHYSMDYELYSKPGVNHTNIYAHPYLRLG